jgi:hypothetical protein
MPFRSQSKQRHLLSFKMRPKLPEVVVVLERLKNQSLGRWAL